MLEQSDALCSEAGVGAYFGPPILAARAAITTDAGTRKQALEQGEALLRGGCVSHCYLYFYEFAIDSQLEQADWPAAERYAGALEIYMRAEPTPWSDFLIQRARVLAQAGRGARAASLQRSLQALADQARNAGVKWRLDQLEQALERFDSGI